MAVDAFNLSTQEAQAGITLRVRGQLELHSEGPCLKHNQNSTVR